MNNHEMAISGLLSDDPVYQELKESMVKTLSSRLEQYLSDDLLTSVFLGDEYSWELIRCALTETAIDTLEDFTGNDRITYSSAD
jgi:hypothetical protein